MFYVYAMEKDSKALYFILYYGISNVKMYDERGGFTPPLEYNVSTLKNAVFPVS